MVSLAVWSLIVGGVVLAPPLVERASGQGDEVFEVARVQSGVPDDLFGEAVGVSADGSVIVGARSTDSVVGLNVGRAYLYQPDGAGAYGLTETIPSPNEGIFDFFGGSVAISDTSLVIGSSSTRDVYEFSRNPLSAGVRLPVDGKAVSTGSPLVVAQPFRIVDNIFGVVSVLTSDGAGGYVISELVPSDGANQATNGFGFAGAVAVEGDTIVVGASLHGGFSQPGAAYVFERGPVDGVFVETSILKQFDQPFASARFGQSVAISGDKIVVGAPGIETVYVFEPNEFGGFNSSTLTASDAAPDDLFGGSVAASGDRIVVGAVDADTQAAVDAGAVYVFDLDDAGGYVETKLVASDGSNGSRFGSSVDVAGDTIAVGDVAFTSTVGAAYIYDVAPPPPSSMYEVTPREMYGQARPSTTSVADPVEPSSGNFFDVWTDLTFGGAASQLNFNRTYNSLDDRVGVLGQGWSTMLDATVTAVGADVEVRTPDGRVAIFVDDGNGGWDRPNDFEADLVSAGGVFSVEFFDGMSWQFDTPGRLASVEWWDGQQIQIARDTGGVPLSVTWLSGMGGSMSFNITVDGDGLISGLTADDGRTVSYGRDTAGFLTSVTGTDGATETYTVDPNGVIGEVFDEEARLVIRNTYDADGRVVLQETATGNIVTFVYDDAVGTTTVSDAASGDVTVYQHNASRQLVGITDANGQSVSRAYDVDGNLAAAVDRRGETFLQVFDVNGNLTASTDQVGQTTAYSYDSDNRLMTSTEPEGDVTAYTYTGADRIPATVIDANGATTVIVSVDGLVTSITDPDGVQTSYSFDDSRNLVSSIDGVGNTTSHTYDSSGRRLSSTTPAGATTSTTYDPDGRVLTSTDRIGEVTTFTYDASGLLVTRTDPTGAVIGYTYDSDGRTETVTDPNGRVRTSTYNDSGDLVAVTDPDGETTTFTFGALARRESSTDATGVTTSFAYDENGNLASFIDGDGQTTATTYDEAGRPIATTDALGNTTTTAYDADGRVSATGDALGNITIYTYDNAGRLSATTLPDGSIRSRTYTSAGRLSTVSDGNGNLTSYGYDSAGRRSTVTDSSGGVTTTVYDADGQVTSVTSPEGLTTIVTYDTAGRPLSSTDPTGATQTATYSARGEVVSVIDPNGSTTGFGFDGAGQLTSTTNPNGGLATYGYDGTGRRTSRTSAAGGVEVWMVDGADRPISATNQVGDTSATAYDNLGRVSTVTDPTGRTTTLTYDVVGQIDQIVYSDGTDSYTVGYSYDAAGRRVSQTDPDGSWQWTYDSRDRLTSVVEPDGSTLGYGYDAVGNRTSFTYPDGTTAAYVFDDLNRMTAVTHPTAGTTAYVYDADGRPLTETLPDGNSRSWSYADGRVTSYTDTQIGTSTIVYDAAGRILSTAGAENWLFTYDSAGQLLTADRDGRSWVYGYDPVGNLVSVDDSVDGLTTFTVDAAGRLTGGTDPDGPLGFDYDTAGRLIRETSGDGTIVEWTYDVRGLPATITTSSGDGGDDAPGCDANLVFTIVGTAGDDVITGTAGPDVIAGLGGNDVIDGLGGDDIICAGKGADTVYGGAGDDLIVGGRGADILYGNGGADIIRGRRGADEIYGGAGADRLHGGRGNDLVVGGGGDDLMFSGAGADVLRGGNGDDELHARKGADVLRGNAGNDLLFGGMGPDTLFGGKGADELHGRRGADSLDGGAGDDILDGGLGVNDVLNGRAGIDICDDGETNLNCETVTSIGTANNPTGTTPIVTSVETRSYDGQGTLSEVVIDGKATAFLWDQSRRVAQVIETSTIEATSSLVYGLERIAAITGASTELFSYTVTGDATQRSDSYMPFGEPVAETGTDDIAFGYRGELHIGDRVHLRARDLAPGIARFTTVDPLDGQPGSVVESNAYSYANNDPINLVDPLGLRAVDGDIDLPAQPTPSPEPALLCAGSGGIVPPPEYPAGDPGAGEYDSDGFWSFTIDDELARQKFKAFAEAAQIRGYGNAAAHLQHYLNNSGSTIRIDPYRIAGDVSEFGIRLDSQARSAATAAAEQAIADGNYGCPVPFSSGWLVFPIAPASSRDWFLALGEVKSAATGTVTVSRGNPPRVEVAYQSHLYDRYNWDDGKATSFGPIVIRDEELAALHRAGVAQEYDVRGTSDFRTYTCALGDSCPSTVVPSSSGGRR